MANAWGPRYWKALHLIAIHYPHAPSLRNARDAFQRIWALVTSLPCEACRSHAAQYVCAFPPELQNNHTLQVWAWSFHNAVNARLGKKLISYDAYSALYGLR